MNKQESEIYNIILSNVARKHGSKRNNNWKAGWRIKSHTTMNNLQTQDSLNGNKEFWGSNLRKKELAKAAKKADTEAVEGETTSTWRSTSLSTQKYRASRVANIKRKFDISDEYDEVEFQGLLSRMYGTPTWIFSAESYEIYEKFCDRVDEKILAGEELTYWTPISYNHSTDSFHVSMQTQIDSILKGKYAKELWYE